MPPCPTGNRDADVSRFLPTAPYRGTRDFLPPQMSVRQQVLDRLYQVAESYGYLRYDGPILEPAEIYEAKSGQEIAEGKGATVRITFADARIECAGVGSD